MKSYLKNFLFAISFLPLAAKFPYIISAWKYSPLDGGDMFMWLSLAFCVPICEFVRRRLPQPSKVCEPHPKFIFSLLIFSLLLWAVLAFRINALGILISIFIVALSTDLRFGRKVFVSQIPSFAFALLACPSVSFWLDYYLEAGLGGAISYFAAKFLLASFFLFIWCASALLKGRYPRLINILFYICVCLALIYNRVESKSLPVGDSIFVNELTLAKDSWVGKDIPPSQQDARFFKGCKKITRRAYFNDSTSINYLGLDILDISNIHPVAICMKSAGYEIESSRQIYIKSENRKIQVNEIIAKIGARKILVYSWFANGVFSTGDFRKFRLAKFSKSKWRHYQLMMPFLKSSSECGNFLNQFFDAFGEKY